MASKTSAVADNEPVDVLFALHDQFNILDFAGPLEVLNSALHDAKDLCMHESTHPCSNNPISYLRLDFNALLTAFLHTATQAFNITVAAAEPQVVSGAGVVVGSQISFKEAHERINEFDIIIVVGGNTDAVIKAKAEPLALISAYSEVQKKDSARE